MLKLFFIIASIAFTCMLITNYAPTWWVAGFNLPKDWPALANFHIAYAWIVLGVVAYLGLYKVHVK